MVLITESFSGPPDLKPDHQILRDGGPVVHCLKMLISSPVQDAEIEPPTARDSILLHSQQYCSKMNQVVMDIAVKLTML